MSAGTVHVPSKRKTPQLSMQQNRDAWLMTRETAATDRQRAIVITRIGLRPGNNNDLLEMLGLMEQENTNV